MMFESNDNDITSEDGLVDDLPITPGCLTHLQCQCSVGALSV
jgi:hypothetical protein